MFLSLLLLSLTVTCTLANNWTNELAAEYWVRPDNTLSCPPSIPPNAQCVTITDLVTDSTNTSFINGVSVNVVFLPGTHVPKKSGLILVGNNVDEGKRAIISGSKNVVINCEPDHEISFYFAKMLSLTLKNFKMQNCGFILSIKKMFAKVQGLYENIPISLVVANVSELLVSDVSIVRSKGVGIVILIMTNMYKSNVTVVKLNKITIDGGKFNKIQLRNLYDPIVKYGFNLFMTSIKTKSYIQKNYEHKNCTLNISITESEFLNSHCRTEWCDVAGGLKLKLVTLERTHILIKNCKFINNTSGYGGGAQLYITSSFRVTITGSLFSENMAIYSGGGLSIVGGHFSISQTEFRQNTAGERGGAIYQNTRYAYKYKHCNFTDNEAQEGPAIYLLQSNCRSIISSSIFTRSKCDGLDTGTIHTTYTCIYKEAHCLQIHNVNITNNKCRGIYLRSSSLKILERNVIKGNHAKQSDGGGIRFDCMRPRCLTSYHYTISTESNATLNIINNTADGYGGGIAIRGVCGHESEKYFSCFFFSNKKSISMKYNTAIKGGTSIYGGSLEVCSLQWNIPDILEINTPSAISSLPSEVCICTKDFIRTTNCLNYIQLETYPGQKFTIPLVCTGQFGYSSQCQILAALNEKSTAKISDEQKLQEIGLECKNITYLIEIQQTNYTETLTLNIVKMESFYIYKSDILPMVINVTIQECPFGFEQHVDGYTGSIRCICATYLTTRGITCSIDNGKLYKNPLAWVGNYSFGAIVVHQNCPFDYCKSDFTDVDPSNQQEQCNFNRTDVLCGTCRPSLSLVLGTSHCKQCSNIYLLLLIPFVLIGLILVFLLLKCNITVSSGTINGLIFYVNILQATQTAFFPHMFYNKFSSMLHVCVSWLNLDLGIQTCFVDGLNTYYRTWLQFVFPLYIWTIVGLLIFISRYSINVSKWTGSNTVSVLATLFLLSYAKLLRTCFDTFSSTTLTNANGTTTSVWLLDARYTFLKWPHNLLFTAGLVTLLAHILPFTILLLTAPILQRYSHHKPLYWVNKFKPLLDAYQGPYRVKFRYWTGLLLMARLVILTAVSLNVSGDQATNLLVIVFVLTVLIIALVVFGTRKLYRNKLPNFLELFFLVNLALLTAISLFLNATKEVNKINGQNIAICVMVGSAVATAMFTLAYHCYDVCLKTKAVKKWTLKLNETKNKVMQADNDVITEIKSTPATTSMVDLKELLIQAQQN